jgi:CubicO group peptidase (beta-lactamase class C family)
MKVSIGTYISFLILTSILLYSCGAGQKEDAPVEYSTYFTDSVFNDLDKELIEKRAGQIDSIFTRMSKSYWFNGGVLYVEKGRKVFSKTYGIADFRSKDTLTEHSAFQLASVSKMFTAMVIMILKEQGELSFEDSVQRFIPGFPYPGVTIRNLLTHRAGLSRYMSLAHDKWPDHQVPLTNEAVINLYMEYRPDDYFSANSGFHYCNTNYALLASVAERIKGEPFAEVVRELIFDPLGMDDSFVYNMDNDTLVPAYPDADVQGHYYRGWRLRPQRNYYLNGVTGDKGIYTSIEDLFKWDQALRYNLLVGDSTIREAYTPGSPKYWKRKDNYGFGWRIKEDRDSTVFHFGWWRGFRTFYIKDLLQDKTLIVLTNKDKGPGSSTLWDIIDDRTYNLGFMSRLKENEEDE